MTDVSAADVGLRVVVRHRIADSGQPSRATDVLGYLQSWTDGTLVIQTRQGLVQIAEDSVLALKRIPEPPERR